MIASGHLAGLMPPRRSFMAQCLAVSLLLHAALVLAWVGLSRPAPPVPLRQPSRPLVVEMAGVVTGHQVAMQVIGEVTLPPIAPEAAPPAKPPERRTRPAPIRAPAKPPKEERTDQPDESRIVARSEPQPIAEPVPTQEPARPATPGDAQTHVQETIAVHESEADAMRRYLAELKRAIQRRLSYPQEARLGAYTGSPVISFSITANGDIQPGSLAVRESSGHAVLDESALAAARAGAPFQPPPRPMRVSIAVSFEQLR